MANDKKDRPQRPRLSGEPYFPGDPIPAPDAFEKDSDSVWELWHRTHSAHEASYAPTAPAKISAQNPGDPRFAATEPASLARSAAGAGPPPAPAVKPPTLDEAMLESRRNNRVCPTPAKWQELYQLLPDRKNNRPTPPLVGPAWQVTPSISKRMCLREHLEWAEGHGALSRVMEFLRQLPEQDWHHMGE